MEWYTTYLIAGFGLLQIYRFYYRRMEAIEPEARYILSLIDEASLPSDPV